MPAPGEEEEEHTCSRRLWSWTLSWSAARPRHSAPVYDPTSLFLRAVFFFKKSQIQPLFCIFWFMIGCMYIVVCDLNIKITGIALFGCSLIFQIFFVIRTEDSILLNLNPNGHIVEAKMEISIIQSNIANEQFTSIFAQILMSNCSQAIFLLEGLLDCWSLFFLFEHLFFCFCSTTRDTLRPSPTVEQKLEFRC